MERERKHETMELIERVTFLGIVRGDRFMQFGREKLIRGTCEILFRGLPIYT